MKASASILVSFVVGALVVCALIWSRSDGDAAKTLAVTESVGRSTPMASAAARAVAAASPTLINIPKLHLKATIGTSLNEGPAWWPVTGRPGGGDTIAVAGHRTTHTRPFYWLDRLRTGDSVYIRWRGRAYAYRVSGRRILSAQHVHIADARGHEVLLLSACTPRGSARQRLVVYAWPRA